MSTLVLRGNLDIVLITSVCTLSNEIELFLNYYSYFLDSKIEVYRGEIVLFWCLRLQVIHLGHRYAFCCRVLAMFFPQSQNPLFTTCPRSPHDKPGPDSTCSAEVPAHKSQPRRPFICDWVVSLRIFGHTSVGVMGYCSVFSSDDSSPNFPFLSWPVCNKCIFCLAKC